LSGWPELVTRRGQNMYSYVTVGTFTGFGGEIAGLKPPRPRLGIL
jgi:hypothetical protein